MKLYYVVPVEFLCDIGELGCCCFAALLLLPDA
jgi:hypothetical protein